PRLQAHDHRGQVQRESCIGLRGQDAGVRHRGEAGEEGQVAVERSRVDSGGDVAERTDAVARAGITAFRGSMATPLARQLIFGIRRQDTPMATARNTLGEYLLD